LNRILHKEIFYAVNVGNDLQQVIISCVICFKKLMTRIKNKKALQIEGLFTKEKRFIIW